MVSSRKGKAAASPSRLRLDKGQGSIQAQLRTLYPTHEAFDAAILDSGSLTMLARQLEINRKSLHLHKKWLDEGARPITKRTRHPRKSNTEIDERIKAFADTELSKSDDTRSKRAAYRYTEVKVYALTSEYSPGQLGTEGLIYLRTETSKTSLPWNSLSKGKKSRNNSREDT